MATIEGRTGAVSRADNDLSTVVLDKRGSVIVTGGGGNYEQSTFRRRSYSGANQGPGGTTTTVGLATTYTGLCVSNPVASTVNLVVNHVGISVVGAPAALSTLGLMAGFHATTNVTHTTALIAHNNMWNSVAGTDGQALVDSASTLPTAPLVVHAFGTIPITGATAQVVNPPVSGVSYDFNGGLILAPGAYVAIYTSTVLTIIASILWTEIPV